ncbi:MAG: hypothetical protein R3E79_12985 [Caldilineaceae bacterium]
MSNGNQSGEKRSDAGGGADKGGGRRRYFRRRKRTQQPAETPSPETRRPQESRKAQEAPTKNRTRNSAKNEGSNKGDRDRRGRRRRRRSRSERGDETPVVRESTVAAIDHEYTLPKAVFVYTYVLRPSHLATHEFRPEHFSRQAVAWKIFRSTYRRSFPQRGRRRQSRNRPRQVRWTRR